MRVPTYKSQAKLSNRSGGINMSVRASPGALSAGSQAMASFGDQAMKTSLQFYEIERRNDYEAQKQKGIVSFNKELEEIKNKSFSMPSSEADSYFDKEAEKARQRISKDFTNDVAQRDYLNESEIDYINKRVSVATNSRNRRINDQAATHLSRVEQLRYDSIYGNAAEKHAALNELFGDRPNKKEGIFDKLKRLQYYNSTQALSAKNAMMANITEGKIYNDFDNINDLNGKENFIKNLKNNPPRSLGQAKIRQLIRSFQADVNGDKRTIKADQKEFVSNIKDLNDVIKKSGSVSEKIINGFATKAKEMGFSKGIELVKRLNLQNNIFNVLKKSTPTQVNNYIIDIEKNGIANVEGVGLDTEYEADLLKDMKSFYSNMKTELNSDPISFAAKTGVIKFQPMDFSTDISDQIAVRIKQASKVSAIYGSDIKYFTDDETKALTTYLQNADIDEKLKVYGIINSGFGSKSGEVLTELNENGPDFAHIGGLIKTKNFEAATLALQGFELIKNGATPADYSSDATETILETIGPALTELDSSVQGSTRSLTKYIYTKLANDAGITSLDDDLLEKALQLSLGRTNKGTGGIDKVNDVETLIPSSLTADMLTNMLEKLTPNNILALTGKFLDTKLIKDINEGDIGIYAIGDGVYKFGRGEKGNADFRYLQHPDGTELVIDAIEYYGLVR